MGEEEMIKHFSHQHSLKLMRVVAATDRYGRSYECYCCGFTYDTTASPFSVASAARGGGIGSPILYSCVEPKCSRVHLCLLCAKLARPRLQNHPLHPHHRHLHLIAHNYIPRDSTCAACCRYIAGPFFWYECEECSFWIHVYCAHSRSVMPSLALTPDPPHPHLLSLISAYFHADDLHCQSCGSPIERSSFFGRCVPCDLNYHLNCNSPVKDNHVLPEMMIYLSGHPHSPLIRVNRSFYRNSYIMSCGVCHDKDWMPYWVYDCLDCITFIAHPCCIFKSSPCPSSNLVVSAASLSTKGGPVHETVARCQACRKRIGLLSAYGCHACNFFLHESCILGWIKRSLAGGGSEEEMLLLHPTFHPEHAALALVFAHGSRAQCTCCGNMCSGFMFCCKDCPEFVLHPECMLLVSSLRHTEHDHPVVLLQKGKRASIYRTSYLHCMQCRKDFRIAGTYLPDTLVHECHFHPLTLVPRLVHEFEQCYCDVCEDVRAEDECIYYCAQCKFEAHIGCVKSEVLGPSYNKLKDVKFVTLDEIEQVKTEIKGRDDFILENELQNIDIYFDKELEDIVHKASAMTWENLMGVSISYDDSFLDKILYSDEPFKTFIKKINSVSSLTNMKSSIQNIRKDRVVRIGGYMVPSSFDPVLETLFDKYGDFGVECTYSQEVKQYLFVGLCKSLQSMCNTKIARVTDDLLIEWWNWFAMGKVAGFKIQFAIESLHRVVYAHFGLEADKHADGKLTRVRGKLRKLPQDIKELTEKLEELTTKLKGTERELEEAETEEMELREAAFRVRKSPLMKKCLQEAEDLVCYYAGETFLPPSE